MFGVVHYFLFMVFSVFACGCLWCPRIKLNSLARSSGANTSFFLHYYFCPLFFFILWNVTQPPGDRVACLKAGPCWRGRRVSRAPPFWAGVLCFRQGYQWLKDKILSEEGRRQQAKLKELQAIAERLGCTLPQLAIGTQTHSAALSLSVCLSVPLPRRSAAPPQLSGFECRACVWVCLCCDVWCLRNQR